MTRNSPTKLLSPGSPTDAKTANRNAPVSHGVTLASPPIFAQVARVGAFVDHPHQQEQRAGRQAVVHHLQHARRSCACSVNAKIPRTTNPRCDTDE